jgi:hypothetical protein
VSFVNEARDPRIFYAPKNIFYCQSGRSSNSIINWSFSTKRFFRKRKLRSFRFLNLSINNFRRGLNSFLLLAQRSSSCVCHILWAQILSDNQLSRCQQQPQHVKEVLFQRFLRIKAQARLIFRDQSSILKFIPAFLSKRSSLILS